MEGISDFWPHKFTKDGNEVQIGEEPLYDTTMRPIYAQPMICVCCQVRFTQGKETRPEGACPARTTRKELKRLKNGGL